MKRLWVRLTLAFALVAAVAVGTVALLLSWQVDSQFRSYLAQVSFDSQGGLAETLASHYQSHGSWEAADEFFGTVGPVGVQHGEGRGPWSASRWPVVLTDRAGNVVYGEAGGTMKDRLESSEVPIMVDGEIVGYLLPRAPREMALGPIEQGFLRSQRTSLLLGAGAAGVLALLLGLALSRGLTQPLHRLADAARAVAKGDLSQRVEVRGSAEIVEVAHSFNEMTAALDQAERLRQNLMADVAHELRTPLTVLQGNLQALLDDVYRMEKAEVALLYDETRLLGRLVEDLRELALAEAGQLRLNLQPVDVGDVVRSTASTFSAVAEEKSVALSSQVEDGVPDVLADPDRLAQVLRNLLSNALRHTPPGGDIFIQVCQMGERVEVTVADTGEGIAPEDLPHVFERFYRVDRSRARGSGGSGLGLTITRQLVLAQSGTIDVESEPGRGSRFRFTLPVAS